MCVVRVCGRERCVATLVAQAQDRGKYGPPAPRKLETNTRDRPSGVSSACKVAAKISGERALPFDTTDRMCVDPCANAATMRPSSMMARFIFCTEYEASAVGATRSGATVLQ